MTEEVIKQMARDCVMTFLTKDNGIVRPRETLISRVEEALRQCADQALADEGSPPIRPADER